MFDNVYLAAPASGESARARGVVQALFDHHLAHPGLLPAGGDPDPVTRVTDYVAGMTDRFALRAYREAFMPREAPL
jgi:dGTPase